MTKRDCRKCGACCIGQLILVGKKDKVPFTMVDGFFMRQQGGRCVALTGRLGRDVSCSIYGQRPKICSVMKPGSWACKEIRIVQGLQDAPNKPL